MATLLSSSTPKLLDDATFDVDKLTCEIFSILENKFLFGYDDPTAATKKLATNIISADNHHIPLKTMKSASKKHLTGKVRILSIDGGGFADGILSGMSLAHLESCLRRKSGNPNARIADYFDVVAGSGSGGVLAALLFTRGKDGRPLCTADEALEFLQDESRRRRRSSPARMLKKMFGRRPARSELGRIFGDGTLKDTLKSVLIPCYDLLTRAPFMFSRADALEMDGYDFKIGDVCMATSADPTVVGAVEMMSVDKSTRILAVDGGVAAMNNPTAAAMTHVLNNKQEFPFCNGVEDLLVVSLGNGESGEGDLTYSSADLVRIAGEGTSDMVDQAVSMAFGECRATNYVRIQANNNTSTRRTGRKLISSTKLEKKSNKETIIGEKVKLAEEMLEQKNVEAVLFQGKKLIQNTNSEKLESFAGEVIKEHERRKNSLLPTVMLKQLAMPSPRTSSATTLSSTFSS